MRARQLSLGIALVAIGLMSAVQAQTQAPPLRTPDVIFVPTPPDVVEAMLKVADVKRQMWSTTSDRGDGIIVVTAAQKYGATRRRHRHRSATGKEANERMKKAGVTTRSRS